MKESVKAVASTLIPRTNGLLKPVLAHLGCAVLTLLMSRTAIFSSFLPLGLSAVAGVSPPYTVSAVIGALIGYFIPATGTGVFKYITAVFAIASIKWLLFGAIRLRNTAPAFAAVALASSLATGFAMLMGDPSPGAAVLVFAESLLAACGAYFINRAVNLRERVTAGMTGQETATLVIAASLVLTALLPLGIRDVSFGRAVLVLVVLSAGKYGGAQIGAVAGTAAAFAVTLPGGQLAAAALPLAVGGLLCGVFAPTGKLASAASMLLTFGVWTLLHADGAASLSPLIEAAVAAVVFLLLPQRAGNFFAEIFAPASRLPKSDGLRQALVMRLEFAADTMRQVSQTVERVSERLAQNRAPGFEEIVRGVELDACSGCSLRVNCWETARGETLDAVVDISKALCANADLQHSVDEKFAGKCLRLPKVCDAVARYYRDYTARQAAEHRLDEVRAVVTDQFEGISDMLSDLSHEFERAHSYDTEQAGELAAALKKIGILASECSCCTDTYGRMRVELRIKDSGKLTLNRRDILRMVEQVCDCEFDPPGVVEGEGEFLVTLSERAVYALDFGVCQYAAQQGRLCGDAYEFFNDGRGRAYLIISDGMGSGGRAAVDGAMASGLIAQLIQAGFGFDCALRIVNSAMLFKSTDESFATLDIACVDLFTGKCELYKAGAAPTLIRRGKKTARASCNSLPAGILQEVGFDHAAVTVGCEDMLVMISDGAATDGTDWICAELEAWQGGNAEKLAAHLADGARRRQGEQHRDDITVLTAVLHKAG